MAKATEQTKVHTRYFNCNGDRLPGVTTVLGVLDKPALMYWAWQCGMNGQDFRKVRDTAASIGTIAHLMVMCHLSGKTPDLSIYSQADIDIADSTVLLDQINESKITIIHSCERGHHDIQRAFIFGQ